MIRASVCVTVLGAVLGIVGCGSDDNEGGGGAKGGSCTNATQCYQVTKPADYDLNLECTALGGTWSKDPCNSANYARKCTDSTIEDDAGQPMTYVYFFPAGSTEDCFGTEEPL